MQKPCMAVGGNLRELNERGNARLKLDITTTWFGGIWQFLVQLHRPGAATEEPPPWAHGRRILAVVDAFARRVRFADLAAAVVVGRAGLAICQTFRSCSTSSSNSGATSALGDRSTRGVEKLDVDWRVEFRAAQTAVVVQLRVVGHVRARRVFAVALPKALQLHELWRRP